MTPAARCAWMGGIGIRLASLCCAIALLLGLQLAAVRPWYKSWGATPDELAAPLPGQVPPAAAPHETRAITISAPSEQVFAWVAQLGQDRAGFYSYELLEDLVGCDMPDLRVLDPRLQNWSVGDRLWMYPPSKIDGMGHATLLHYEPGRVLVFGTQDPLGEPGAPPTNTWSFLVNPVGPHASRLIARASGAGPPSLLGKAFNRGVFEPLHFAMERRMLEGIAALAEGRAIPKWHDHLQLLSWASSFLALLAAAALIVLGRDWLRHLAGFVAAGLVFQLVTLLQPSPIVGLLLVLALVPTLLPSRRATAARGLVEQPS